MTKHIYRRKLSTSHLLGIMKVTWAKVLILYNNPGFSCRILVALCVTVKCYSHNCYYNQYFYFLLYA